MEIVGKIKKAVVILAYIAISVIIIELLLRVFNLGNVYNIDPRSEIHIFKPGSKQVTIKEGFGVRNVNSFGTFDRESRQVSDSMRILLFGDSMTEAFQVYDDQVYDNIAEDILKENGLDVEIVNFGRSGYGTIDEFALYDGIKDKIAHEIVIIQFSSGDVIENQLSKNKIVGGELVLHNRGEKESRIRSTIWRLKERSLLINMAAARLDVYRTLYDSWRSGKKIEKMDDEVGKALNDITYEQEIYLFTILREFKKCVENSGAKLILIQLIDQTTVNGSYETAKKICEELELGYFSLVDSLSDKEKEEVKVGFMNTKLGYGHLNKVGHKIFGNKLAELIEKEI